MIDLSNNIHAVDRNENFHKGLIDAIKSQNKLESLKLTTTDNNIELLYIDFLEEVDQIDVIINDIDIRMSLE